MTRQRRPDRADPTGGSIHSRQRDESWIVGGLSGIAAVTVATFALALVGLLIAFVVSLAF